MNIKEITYFNNRKEEILIKENKNNQRCQNETSGGQIEKNENTKLQFIKIFKSIKH